MPDIDYSLEHCKILLTIIISNTRNSFFNISQQPGSKVNRILVTEAYKYTYHRNTLFNTILSSFHTYDRTVQMQVQERQNVLSQSDYCANEH